MQICRGQPATAWVPSHHQLPPHPTPHPCHACHAGSALPSLDFGGVPELLYMAGGSRIIVQGLSITGEPCRAVCRVPTELLAHTGGMCPEGRLSTAFSGTEPSRLSMHSACTAVHRRHNLHPRLCVCWSALLATLARLRPSLAAARVATSGHAHAGVPHANLLAADLQDPGTAPAVQAPTRAESFHLYPTINGAPGFEVRLAAVGPCGCNAQRLSGLVLAAVQGVDCIQFVVAGLVQLRSCSVHPKHLHRSSALRFHPPTHPQADIQDVNLTLSPSKLCSEQQVAQQAQFVQQQTGNLSAVWAEGLTLHVVGNTAHLPVLNSTTGQQGEMHRLLSLSVVGGKTLGSLTCLGSRLVIALLLPSRCTPGLASNRTPQHGCPLGKPIRCPTNMPATHPPIHSQREPCCCTPNAPTRHAHA